MSKCKSISTPLAQYFKLSSYENLQNEADRRLMEKVQYSYVVGCLMNEMICIRLDLEYPISLVNRIMVDLRKTY